MIHILLGEDSSLSRQSWVNIKKEFLKKNVLVSIIESVEDLTQISSGYTVQSLFNKKQVYFCENLFSKKIKTTNKKALFSIKTIQDLNIDIYDWEDGIPKWRFKLPKDIKAKIVEFKPPHSIFKLLDSMYPSNLNKFINILSSIDKDENFIFNMIVKRTRQLLMIKLASQSLKNIQPWQIIKLKKQASLWNSRALIEFYNGLFKIEKRVRTNTTPYNLKESLEIITSHYL